MTIEGDGEALKVCLCCVDNGTSSGFCTCLNSLIDRADTHESTFAALTLAQSQCVAAYEEGEVFAEPFVRVKCTSKSAPPFHI